jgi:heme exporter protein D
MESAMSKFLEMGGYAVYVWPAFATAALVMIGLLVDSLRTLRAREDLLKRLGDAEPRADRDA